MNHVMSHRKVDGLDGRESRGRSPGFTSGLRGGGNRRLLVQVVKLNYGIHFGRGRGKIEISVQMFFVRVQL